MEKLGRAGRIIFGICIGVFGAQYFLYRGYAGGLAAGISIATGIYSRVAGILLGSMFLFWVIFLHAPRVMAQIRNGDEWTSAFIALAMGTGAFIVAERARVIAGPQNAQH